MKAIRLARVLAALLMVTAGEAGADCAWVLWSSLSELDPLNPGKLSETAVVWRIHRAVGSQNECTQNQSSLLARWRDEAQRKARLGELTVSPQFAEPDGRITMFHEESGKVVRTFMERALCLPDTACRCTRSSYCHLRYSIACCRERGTDRQDDDPN